MPGVAGHRAGWQDVVEDNPWSGGSGCGSVGAADHLETQLPQVKVKRVMCHSTLTSILLESCCSVQLSLIISYRQRCVYIGSTLKLTALYLAKGQVLCLDEKLQWLDAPGRNRLVHGMSYCLRFNWWCFRQSVSCGRASGRSGLDKPLNRNWELVMAASRLNHHQKLVMLPIQEEPI